MKVLKLLFQGELFQPFKGLHQSTGKKVRKKQKPVQPRLTVGPGPEKAVHIPYTLRALSEEIT